MSSLTSGCNTTHTEREFVIKEPVFTRTGTGRVLRYAFALAQSRSRKYLTIATKSNGIALSTPDVGGSASTSESGSAIAWVVQTVDM